MVWGRRASRDTTYVRIRIWRDSELKAAPELSLGTETFPRLFSRQVSADSGVGYGLSPIVYDFPFQ